MDLLIVHERFGSSSDPSINGHLHYPHDDLYVIVGVMKDWKLKLWELHTSYTLDNNRPSNTISFMSVITSKSDRLHSDFVFLLFLQDHRETDRFFVVSGVQVAQSTSGQFHYRRTTSSHLKSKVENILTKTAGLWITLNIDGAPIVSKSHTPPSQINITLANLSSINLVDIFRCSSPPRNPVYVRLVDPSALSFSLSSHRHSYISLVFSVRFID